MVATLQSLYSKGSGYTGTASLVNTYSPFKWEYINYTPSTSISSNSGLQSTPDMQSLALSFGISGISSILNAVSSYNESKHNLSITNQNAQALLEHTESQVDKLNKQYYLTEASNRVYAFNSGLDTSSFTDVIREGLTEKEQTVDEMRTYARKQAQVMIEEARRAKRKAKKAKSGSIIGAIGGAAIGAAIGGPYGAMIGGGAGGQLGAQFTA